MEVVTRNVLNQKHHSTYVPTHNFNSSLVLSPVKELIIVFDKQAHNIKDLIPFHMKVHMILKFFHLNEAVASFKWKCNGEVRMRFGKKSKSLLFVFRSSN